MAWRVLVAAVVWCAVAAASALGGGLPAEPVEIGTTPQFFVDDYMVDNRFAIKYKHNEVVRRFHPPVKHHSNPLLVDEASFASVIFDDQTGRFRMWYQLADRSGKAEGESTRYAIAYAESADGIGWERPNLDLYEWKGTRQNNVVWRGTEEARASGMQLLLSVPEADRRGRRFLMSYRVGGSGRETDGIRLILSDDGLLRHADPLPRRDLLGLLVGLPHERPDLHRAGHQPRRHPLGPPAEAAGLDPAW